jgi:hypothetical protein
MPNIFDVAIPAVGVARPEQIDPVKLSNASFDTRVLNSMYNNAMREKLQDKRVAMQSYRLGSDEVYKFGGTAISGDNDFQRAAFKRLNDYKMETAREMKSYADASDPAGVEMASANFLDKINSDPDILKAIAQKKMYDANFGSLAKLSGTNVERFGKMQDAYFNDNSGDSINDYNVGYLRSNPKEELRESLSNMRNKVISREPFSEYRDLEVQREVIPDDAEEVLFNKYSKDPNALSDFYSGEVGANGVADYTNAKVGLREFIKDLINEQKNSLDFLHTKNVANAKASESSRANANKKQMMSFGNVNDYNIVYENGRYKILSKPNFSDRRSTLDLEGRNGGADGYTYDEIMTITNPNLLLAKSDLAEDVANGNHIPPDVKVGGKETVEEHKVDKIKKKILEGN